jgi:aspartyl protease family protein
VKALLSALLALLLALPVCAAAESVALAGRMGAKALLVIDGQTQMLAVGETARGVRLVSLDGDRAVVDRAGAQTVLQVGAAPVRVGGGPAPTAQREAVIPASSGGHFVASGAINGRPVQFLVDTGATLVAISQGEADRLGLDYKRGRQGVTQTANGAVLVHVVTLASVRVGGIELSQVEAVVVPAPMPMVLLGNSFLSRLRMQRDTDVMRLEVR